MGRFVVVVAMLAATLTGCGDTDADDEPADAVTYQAEDFDRDRYVQACGRAVGPDDSDRCGVLLDEAIEAALEQGCSPRSVEAYLEHGLASGFATEPDPSFFERCPSPLSTMMITEAPEGYAEVNDADSEVGLMDSRALAELFDDVDAWESYLDEVGHEVSYSQHWRRDGDSLVVRLDRFATVDGATVHARHDDRDELAVTSTTIFGTGQGVVVETELDRPDQPQRHQQLASGRVCNLTITMFHRAVDEPLDTLELIRWFDRQASRVRASTSC